MLLLFVHAMAAGRTYLSADTFTVQTKVRVEYVYVVGPEGLAVGDSIRIKDPRFHGIRWSKWGTPQLSPGNCTELETAQDPSISLVTASTARHAAITLSRNVDASPALNTEAWSTVVIESGALVEDDEIVVVYGDDTVNPLCGHEMPDRAFHHVDWEAEEDIGGAGWVAVSPTPTFDVVADATPVTLHVEAPSRVLVDELVPLKVAVLDYLGNAIGQWEGTVTVDPRYGGATWTSDGTGGGWHDFGVRVSEAGVVRLRAVTDAGLAGTSNPIEVLDAEPDARLWWGDIHSHNGHSYWEDGEYIDENVVYGRDVIGLDVVCETEKAEPVELDGAALWADLQANCAGETVDGRFVDLLGFEWMGDVVDENAGGHHNFYFDTCDAPLGAHYYADTSPDGIAGFGTGFGPYEWAAARIAEGTQVVVIPHATLFTGFDWSPASRDDDLRPVAEIYSEWGISMEPAGRVGSIVDGLNSGHRLGFIGGSDNHDGWMGNPFSLKDMRSGLVAFWSPTLDRAGIFSALQTRWTYATSGARILLSSWIEDGATVRSGLEYVAEAPVVHWEAHGTDGLAEVRLMTLALVEDAVPVVAQAWSRGGLDGAGSFALEWDGADQAVWVELTQAVTEATGDAERAWSSPFWLTAECGRVNTVDPAGRCEPDDSGETGDTGPLVDTDPGAVPGDSGEPGGSSRCDGCGGAGAPTMAASVLAAVGVRRRRKLAPLAFVALLCGCPLAGGGKEDEAPEPEPGIAEDVFITRVSESACAWEQTCDPEAFAVSYADMATCIEAHEQEYHDAAACFADCPYDDEQAATCIDALARQTCDDAPDADQAIACSVYACDLAQAEAARECLDEG